MNENFIQVFDDLFPIEKTAGLYVGYRSHKDLYTHVLEYSFVIGFAPSKKGHGLDKYLTAQVRIADSVSVYDQLMKMHRDSPARDLASIRKELKVKTWNLAETNCPAVKRQWARFQEVRISPPDNDRIVFHPLIHEFRVQALAGSMDIELSDEEHSLVVWALDTRKALDDCIAESRSEASRTSR